MCLYPELKVGEPCLEMRADSEVLTLLFELEPYWRIMITAIREKKIIGGIFGALLTTIIDEVLPGACLIAGALLVINK